MTSSAKRAGLPPLLSKILSENGSLMSSNAIAEIKDAIRRINAKEQKEEKYVQIRNRYYEKKELAEEIGEEKLKELGMTNSKLPYGVDVVNGKHYFKGPGLQGLNVQNSEHYQELLTRIVGAGRSGKIIPLINMDDPDAKDWCVVKIKNNLKPETLKKDKEFKHAQQAGLAFAESSRQSPSHGSQLQKRIYMHPAKGMELNAFFAKYGECLSPQQLIIIFRNLCKAVKNGAHQFNAVHRDLKPYNFFIDPETLQCQLLDFGEQVTLPKSGEHNSKRFAGTPLYTAPEIADVVLAKTKRYKYTQQCDLYSLGVTFADLCGLISFSDYQLSDARLFAKGGVSLSYYASEKFRMLFPEIHTRNFLFEFIELLTHKNLKYRIKSIDACIEFFETFEAFLTSKDKTAIKAHLKILDAKMEEADEAAETTKKAADAGSPGITGDDYWDEFSHQARFFY